jgi:hypothetical protein
LIDSCHFIQEDYLINVKQKLHHVRLNEWTTRFKEQKASGLTVRQWCVQNQVSIHTYNYRKHVLKEEFVNQMLHDIVPVTFPIPISSNLPAEQKSPCLVQENRAIRANCTTVKLTINGISIEMDFTVHYMILDDYNTFLHNYQLLF